MKECSPSLVLALAALLAVACGGAGSGRGASREGGAEGVAARATNEAAMPGPARARGEQAVAANRACEGCHEEEARAWRGSLHQRANLEPSYRRAFTIEPMPFCRGCHAPEAAPAEMESEEVGAMGVGCVTCHVTDGDVLAAPWTRPGAPPPSPHAVVREARFATADACARCHEFGFPGTPGRHTQDKMQWTVTEHARSKAAKVACAGCHMPAGASGGRGHSFAASRDPAILARAVRIAATRESASRVRVVLSPEGAGHAFPTGDLFRRIEVLAESEGPDRMVLSRDVRYLARHFEGRAGGVGRRLVRDDRVFDAPVTVDLDLGAAAEGRAIVYRVTYQRVAHPNGINEEEAEIDGEVVLAEGRCADSCSIELNPPRRR